MGQQPAVLPPCRCFVVQSVLRTVARKGLPYKFAYADDTLFLHTYGSQRGILQCLGYNLEGVERLFAEDHRRAFGRHRGAHHIVVLAATGVKA